MHPAYTPALSSSLRVRVATRGHPNPPMGRSVNWAQHICISPASSCTGAVGGISEIVASAIKFHNMRIKNSDLEFVLQLPTTIPSLS